MVKTDFQNFKKEFSNIQKAWGEEIKEAKSWATVTYYSLVVNASPVLSGRYKASHQLEFTESAESAPEGLTDAQYSNEQEKEEIKIKAASFSSDNQTWYIANNVQYSEVLESGRSRKAPSGIYGPQFNKFEPMLRKKMSELSKKRYK